MLKLFKFKVGNSCLDKVSGRPCKILARSYLGLLFPSRIYKYIINLTYRGENLGRDEHELEFLAGIKRIV